MSQLRGRPQNDVEAIGQPDLISPRRGHDQVVPPFDADAERRVLLAVGEGGGCLTFGQLRARTGLPREELIQSLQVLRKRGQLRRLNTVVESYASAPVRDRPGE